MGNLYKENFDKKIWEKFSNINILTKKECSSCWAKYYCSGGCIANNNNFSKDILTPNILYCELEKKRRECAIAIKVFLNITK